jgi:hypothetical protein
MISTQEKMVLTASVVMNGFFDCEIASKGYWNF